jgi:hypothetical protein
MSLVIGAGFRTRLGWLPEASFNTVPTSATANWFGQVQQIQETLNQNIVEVYRLDGETRYPAYLLQGQRAPSLSIEYYPQDISFLSSLLSGTYATPSTSYDVFVDNVDTATGLTWSGLKMASIAIKATMGDPIDVTVSMQGANSSGVVPANISYATDYASTPPMYFASAAVWFGSTLVSRVIDFTMTINATVQSVYQYNTPVLQDIVTTTGQALGTMQITWENTNDYNTALTLAQTEPVTLVLGPDNTSTIRQLQLTNVVFGQYQRPITAKDFVAMNMNYEATNVTVF